MRCSLAFDSGKPRQQGGEGTYDLLDSGMIIECAETIGSVKRRGGFFEPDDAAHFGRDQTSLGERDAELDIRSTRARKKQNKKRSGKHPFAFQRGNRPLLFLHGGVLDAAVQHSVAGTLATLIYSEPPQPRGMNSTPLVRQV